MEASEAKTEARDELIATLLRAALSRPEGEREAYLREACAGLGDPHDSDDLLRTVTLRANWESRLAGFLLSPVLARERIDRPFQVDDLINQRFEIVRLAGEGGMGVVYEAVDKRLGERRALKCPRFEFRRRLSPEAVNALRITDPHVCRVYELHTADSPLGEVDFLAMEFLEGETLAARLPNAPPGWLESKDGAGIARQICAGIRAIHAKGIVHCDLKSNNVMLSPDPASGSTRATIMDFGISQTADIFSSQTRGTPAYMAPELWRGQRPTVQSDIYALGVLLYEMASAGRQPFDDSVTWSERLTAVPPPARASRQVRSAIARCVHPDPAQRFQSVDEFERQMWGGTTRRALFRSTAGVAACGGIVWLLTEPTSPVRVAVLAPTRTGDGIRPELADGFVQDLIYRLKTIGPVRRPCLVFSISETKSMTAATAAAELGATHAVLVNFSAVNDKDWKVAAEIRNLSNGRVLERYSNTANPYELASIQSSIVDMVARELALRPISRVTRQLPDSAYSDYIQGLHFARVDIENAKNAIPYFERVIAAAPDSALGYAGLAEALIGSMYMSRDSSMEARALDALAKAEEREPDSAHVHFIKGRLDIESGFLERAVASFRRAAELSPTDPMPLIMLGYVNRKLNRVEDSAAAFAAAAKVQPGYYLTHSMAGMLYLQQRDFRSAEREWLEAVRLAPGHTRGRLNLASLYLSQNRLAEAEFQGKESIAIRKTRDALLTLGAVRERRGHLNEAIADYEEAFRVGPRYYQSWPVLALALRRAGRAEQALRVFRTGLEDTELDLRRNPRNAELIAWAAYYRAELGESATARTLATRAWEMARGNGDVRNRLVITYDVLQDFPAACSLLTGAPRDAVNEIADDRSISAGLRQNPCFQQLLH